MFCWPVFLPLTLLYLLSLIIVCPTVYFKLWIVALPPNPANILPTLITGTAIAEIKLSGNISMVTVALNCSGQVLVTSDFDCSELKRTSNYQSAPPSPMQYLLSGSLIHVYYDIPYQPHKFAIIQSLDTFRQKCTCASDTYDYCFDAKSHLSPREDQSEECKRHCQEDTLCPSQLAGPSNLNGIQCLSNLSSHFTVSANDFYYLEFGEHQCPRTRSVTALSYNIEELPSGRFSSHSLTQSDPNSPYSTSFKMPDSESGKGCVLLDVQCLSDRVAYTIEYNATVTPVEANNFHSFLAWGVMATVGVVLAIGLGVTFCWRFAKRRKLVNLEHHSHTHFIVADTT